MHRSAARTSVEQRHSVAPRERVHGRFTDTTSVRSTQVPRKTHPSMPPRQRRRPTPSMVVALIALFVALEGPAAAGRLIGGPNLRANSLTSRQIRHPSLGAADLTRGAVRALQRTPNGSVG